MKIRTGFVSNSSSTSFYVATRSGSVTTEQMMAVLGVPVGTPAAKLFEPLVEFMTGGIAYEMESYCDNFGCDSAESLVETYGNDQDIIKVLELLKAGWTLSRVRASSDSCEGAEMFFYDNSSITLDTPDIKIFGVEN